MKVAVIADIHGNLQALEAVLAEIDKESPDMLLVGGDMVNRCVQGREVLERLSERPHLAVHGNADLNIAHARNPAWSYVWPPMAEIAPFYHDQIGPEWAAHLRDLPDHRWIDVPDGPPLLLAHALPGDPFHGITTVENERRHLRCGNWPDALAEPAAVRTTLQECRPSLFLTAHSHRQFDRVIEGVRVANPGPVCGQTTRRDGWLLAEFMIATWRRQAQAWDLSFRTTPFDVEETLRHLHRARAALPALEWIIRTYERQV